MQANMAAMQVHGVSACTEWRAGQRVRGAGALALGALFLGLGLWGCFLGFGTDRDTLRVVQSAQSILGGHYIRSRSWGFPLHEAAAALLWAAGGLSAVNIGSLMAAALGVGAAMRLLPPGRRVLSAAMLAFSPLILVNASSGIDFDWDMAAGMAVLLTAREAGSLRGLGVHGVAIFALLLLRPDNVLFAAAATLAACAVERERAAGLIGSAVLAGVAAAGMYLGLNGAEMLLTGVTTTRPWPARLMRAGVFLSAGLGPAGTAALWMIRRDRGFLTLTAAFSWALYLPRFVTLPDQLDYLILPVSVSLLAAAAHASLQRLRLLALAAVLPSVITVSLLARDPASGAVRLSIRPQWGALMQDFAARRFNGGMDGDAERMRVQAAVPGAGPLRHETFLPGFTSPGGDLVIGRPHLYRVLALGNGAAAQATVAAGRFRRVYACSGAVFGAGSGWRAWEAPDGNSTDPLRCSLALSH